jgi:hypothetical protein
MCAATRGGRPTLETFKEEVRILREPDTGTEAAAPPNCSFTHLLVKARYDNVAAQSGEGDMCKRLRL